MRSILFIAVTLYQYVFSPDKGILRILYPVQGACRMYPTCSEYMTIAVKKYGTMKGVVMGVMRIGRCHPFQKKLIDEP